MEYVERQLDMKKCELEDILAIEKIMKLLSDEERISVEFIYFSNLKLTKAKLSELIENICSLTSSTEKAVHGYLRKARILFAHERGLRVY